jgi:L-ascorbate metabolism protein UlaG (beta-lactamase superfamily)
MIVPLYRNARFLADVAANPSRSRKLNLWWLGQSGYLMDGGGSILAIDPYLSDSLTKKYANTDKPHVRMSSIVISPEQLALLEIAVISCSHQHTDHMDPETLAPLVAGVPELKLVVPRAWRALAQERSGASWDRVIGIDAHQQVELDPFTFHAVPAAHEEIERDEHGHQRYLGYVIRVGSWTVYHSGDTMLFDGIVETLRPYNINVAILPINGRAPERRVAGNLSGREAAWLAKEIGAKLVVPCHYDMFEFNTASPDEFVGECERLGQPYKVLQIGERLTLTGRLRE